MEKSTFEKLPSQQDTLWTKMQKAGVELDTYTKSTLDDRDGLVKMANLSREILSGNEYGCRHIWKYKTLLMFKNSVHLIKISNQCLNNVELL